MDSRIKLRERLGLGEDNDLGIEVDGSIRPGISVAQRNALENLLHPDVAPYLDGESFYCCVCATWKHWGLFCVRISPECLHSASVCLNCIVKSIAIQMNSKIWDHITCPDCGKLVTYEFVLHYADEKTRQDYDRRGVRRVLETLPEWRWCLGKGCESGQLNEGGPENPIVCCVRCGFRQCFTHGVRWHTDQTCAQVDGRAQASVDASEAASQALFDATTIIYPGSCGYRISKAGGCAHMTCKACKHQYCWECLAPYEPILRGDNHLHARWCSSWSPPGSSYAWQR